MKSQEKNKNISAILKKMKENIQFRVKVFLFASFIFNFLYAIFLFILGQLYLSKWFFVFSLYHILLSSIRIYIFFQVSSKKDLREKTLIMRTCGWYLLSLNLAFSAMMFILIYEAPKIQHHEIIVITLATYTFPALTFSILGCVKHWKRNDYLYFCAKMISLISASISMATLTNTMLATFGNENALLRSIILPILCGFISIFIIVCAILMIKQGNSKLRTLQNEQE